MAEDSGEKRDWKSPWGIIKNTIRNTFKPSAEVAKAKIGEAAEVGKEKALNLVEASKGVLDEFKNKTVEAFAKFPNKLEFAHASFVAIGGVVFKLLAGAAVVGSMPDPNTRIAGVAGFAAGSIMLDGFSLVLFKDWYSRSKPGQVGK